ncbi:MAG TPA: hypothetical protein VGF59_27450 [Bryobacteraceae bacterium]|jgi:hypothetical protein
MDLRDELIARVVTGRSFADVGGLWGTVNEKVTVAARQGAAALAMIDVAPPDHELWRLFLDRVTSSGAPSCECVSADICARADGPQYDVVHCSGVLYHHPSPLVLLEALRRITLRHLILTSTVIHESIANELGTLHVPSSGVVFVPALDGRERAILRKHWLDITGSVPCYGISEPAQWDPHNFDPWWWLMTPQVMLAMAASVGFRVLDSGPIWSGNAYTALLESDSRYQRAANTPTPMRE